MSKTQRTAFLVILLGDVIYGQSVIGHPCNLQSSEARGVCKLLTDCKQVRDEVVNLQRLPQTCGFQETQPIVCCPHERKPGDISRQKCKEYSFYAQRHETGGSTVCENKIVKGLNGEVSRKEFPHMAIIEFKRRSGIDELFCAGSMISERYILTEAYCVLNKSSLGSVKVARVGLTQTYNTNDDTERYQRQDLPISEIIIHPKYKPPVQEHDIALLKLENSIQLNFYARPACLHTDLQIPDEKVIVTGWGRTVNDGVSSENLLKFTLEFIYYKFCHAVTMGIPSFSEIIPSGLKDDMYVCSQPFFAEPCEFDAEGPLQIYHEGDEITCMYDIIGVVSFLKGCVGGPKVYSRVSYYIEWIESVVWPSK